MDRQALRIAAVIAGMAVTGTLSVASAPEGTHIGYMWPTGLATGALLLGSRNRAPVAAALMLVLAALTYLPGSYPAAVAILYAAVVVLEAWVVDRMIPRHSDGWAWLLRTNDVARYVAACTAGAAVGAVGFLTVSAVTGFGTAWQVGVAAFGTHLASQLILVPLFLRIPPRVLRLGRPERAVRWALTIGLAFAALVPPALPSLVFLLLPMLGWSSVRATMRESQLLVLAVTGIAAASASLGQGPFSRLESRFMTIPELATIPLQAFLVACVLVTIPLALAVRQEREAQRQAAAERSRTDHLLDAAQGLVIVGTDDLGRINLFNTGAERVLGYTAEEVLGQSPEIFHTHAEIERLARLFGCKPSFFHVIAAFLAREVATPMDWEFIRKDGEKRILAFLLTPVYSEGQVIGFLASADDMTDRVRTQHALEHALTKALAAESDAISKLAEVDRAKDSFVSAVSHELRTPITNLVGYLELLRDGSYGDLSIEQDQALSRIELNSQRLLALIDDLLTLARIEEPQFAAGHAPTDLRELVQQAATELRPIAEANGLRVQVEVTDEPVLVIGDAGQLGRLLANLADNAAKFTPFGGTVSLGLGVEDGLARLEVADTGLGIPPGEQDRVFNRFFRATTAEAGAIPGTGLGLFIAKAIVEAHSAQIGFRSLPGEGTTFTVRFPLTEAAATA